MPYLVLSSILQSRHQTLISKVLFCGLGVIGIPLFGNANELALMRIDNDTFTIEPHLGLLFTITRLNNDLNPPTILANPWRSSTYTQEITLAIGGIPLATTPWRLEVKQDNIRWPATLPVEITLVDAKNPETLLASQTITLRDYYQPVLYGYGNQPYLYLRIYISGVDLSVPPGHYSLNLWYRVLPQ